MKTEIREASMAEQLHALNLLCHELSDQPRSDVVAYVINHKLEWLRDLANMPTVDVVELWRDAYREQTGTWLADQLDTAELGPAPDALYDAVTRRRGIA